MLKVKNGFNVNKKFATLKRPIAVYIKCCFGYKNLTGTDKIFKPLNHAGNHFLQTRYG